MRRALRRVSLLAQILIIVVVLALAAAVWIAIHAVDAGSRLESVRDDIAQVRADLVDGKNPTVDLRATQADARAAEHDTHDPVWFTASWLPPVHTVRGLASAVNELATQALPQVVSLGTTIEPSKLRVARNTIALEPLVKAAPTLSSAETALVKARDQVAGLSGGWGLLGTARGKVLAQLTSLTGSIDDASRFAHAGPDMLGANGLRRYFVAIENNAETRATGGLVAAYAIVTADHGKIRVVQRGNDSAFRNSTTPVASLPADYNDVYGVYTPAENWDTSNLSPNFPYAAQIWAGLWQKQSGKHIDGAFGVDPFALADMLDVTGPVSVTGYPGVYSGANLASFIESGEYKTFTGADQTLRKKFVSRVAGRVLHQLLSGAGSPSAITTALGAAAGAGHLALWSANPADEAQISGTPLAGELPVTRAPFASVDVDSATGTKLDYYLDRRLDYRATSCSGSTRQATITVTLDNAAPLHGLPPYVRSRGDLRGGAQVIVERVPRERLIVYVHATEGAALERASLDGKELPVGEGVELGHPVYNARVTLDPGVPRTMTFQLQEPVTPGKPQTQVQPMARAQHTDLNAPVCM